jgi:hypothetical protein
MMQNSWKNKLEKASRASLAGAVLLVGAVCAQAAALSDPANAAAAHNLPDASKAAAGSQTLWISVAIFAVLVVALTVLAIVKYRRDNKMLETPDSAAARQSNGRSQDKWANGFKTRNKAAVAGTNGNHRRKIIDYNRYFNDLMSNVASNNISPEPPVGFGGKNRTTDIGQLLGQQFVVLGGDPNASNGDIIASQKNLIEDQKRLIVEQSKLIEEKSRLIAEKNVLLKMQSDMLESKLV